jgi:hypothetical protein
MLKFVQVIFTRKKKSPKKKSPSPATKRADNIERKFKRLLKNGYSIPQARYYSRL